MPTSPRRRLRVLAIAAGLGALAVGGLRPTVALASSHHEAPLIAEDPLADPTDVYAFRSPDRPDTVTLVANFVPFQQPAVAPTSTASATTCCTRSTSTTWATVART